MKEVLIFTATCLILCGSSLHFAQGFKIREYEFDRKVRLDSLQEAKLRLEVERLKTIDSTFYEK